MYRRLQHRIGCHFLVYHCRMHGHLQHHIRRHFLVYLCHMHQEKGKSTLRT